MIDRKVMVYKFTPMKFSTQKEEFSIPELISGCVNGKKESWDLFFQKFHRLVTGIAFHKSHDSMEDAVQTIYLRLIEDDYRVLKKFNGSSYGAFLLYLKEVCRNVVKEENKKFSQKKSHIVPTEVNTDSIVDPKSIGTPENDEEREQLLEKIMELKMGFREVMVLKLNGYKAREIAEILNLPLNTVLTRIKRSIEKFKKNEKMGIKSPQMDTS
jgi:RNA polymerase sigma factor (sigma-70 family)